jgi:small subunit ribosomal protein S1
MPATPSADAAEENLHFPEEEMPESAMDMVPASIRPGDIVRGYVVKVSPEEAVVDVGLKSEGVIPMEEFQMPGQDLNLFVGKEIDVVVISPEGREGLPILSYKQAIERVSRMKVQEAYESGGHVECRLVEKTKGGFKVDVNGLVGFMPFSQTGVRRGDEKALNDLLGKTVEAKVMELRPKRDAVFSRRAYLDDTRKQMRDTTLAKLEPGILMQATVKNITSFGAFVDLGGVDALLHINDMAWQHIANPRDVVEVGQKLEVKVLSVEGEKISVGLKQKTQDPWHAVPAKYKEGSKVRGTITSLTKYGAFLEIEPGIEGLIHISEMSWTKHIKHPSELFKVGDSVLAMVLQINMDEKRISLGFKQTMDDPWKVAAEKYPSGTKVKGEVSGLTDFGAFIRLEEGIEGMVHVSDLSWTEKVRHPKDVLQKGDIVEVVVREIDPNSRRMSLSLKHVVDSPWEQAGKELRTGGVVEGEVKKLADFGAFVEIADGVEGLIHISEISDEKIEHPSKVLKVGDKVKVKILKFDKGKEKVSLSLKAYQAAEDRKELAKYMDDAPKGLTSMAEIINAALQKKDSSES